MFKHRFENNKALLLNDKNINSENRKLFKEFFELQETKLKRINDNAELDEPSYKTLYTYVNKLRNVNTWFKNKSWKDITLEDIKKVYNDLEDGNIKNSLGKRFEDRRSYYNKVFKSLPFRLAGKDTLSVQALNLFTDRRKKEVTFVNEENFKQLVSVVSNPVHLALFWLSWDIGENINTLLRLTKANFKKQINKDTKEEEYRVWLPQVQLKRSRQPRSEITLFPETTRYLDIVLSELDNNDLVFDFQYRQAVKLFDSAIKRGKVICEPTGKKPSWKDLRTGMVMNLFTNYGWNSDDINLRLGHSITSRELEAYFSYGAGKGKRAKKQHFNSNIEKLQDELNDFKIREKSNVLKIQELEEQNKKIMESISNINLEVLGRARENMAKFYKKADKKRLEAFK